MIALFWWYEDRGLIKYWGFELGVSSGCCINLKLNIFC